jgi:hypothetical protein
MYGRLTKKSTLIDNILVLAITMKTKTVMSMSSSMLIQMSSFMKRLQGDLNLEGVLALESRMKYFDLSSSLVKMSQHFISTY